MVISTLIGSFKPKEVSTPTSEVTLMVRYWMNSDIIKNAIITPTTIVTTPLEVVFDLDVIRDFGKEIQAREAIDEFVHFPSFSSLFLSLLFLLQFTLFFSYSISILSLVFHIL